MITGTGTDGGLQPHCSFLEGQHGDVIQISGVCWWQGINKPTMPCWLLLNEEEPVRAVKAECSLSSRNLETVKFKTLREVSKTNSRITALDLRRTDTGLLRVCLAGSCRRLPWRAKGPRRTSWYSKWPPKAPEQCVSTCRELQSWQKANIDEKGAPDWAQIQKYRKYAEGGRSNELPGRNTETLPEQVGTEWGKANLRVATHTGCGGWWGFL